ncbi:phosphotransferase family protein [Tsukamurella soli]|uniref:Aminoglycoside phosphotransferase family protein n=1 Tax=Tsukamurella soli TaxID=644556 RepID=A0ABP8J5Z4_9ACTN
MSTTLSEIEALGLWAGAAPDALESPTMASPSWWGADSRRWSVRAQDADPRCGTTGYVKLMEPHTRMYIDFAVSFDAARSAGAAGGAPAVRHADADRGVLVTEDHTGRCHTGTLDRFDDPDTRNRLLALRRAVHDLPRFGRTATVFDDIRAALDVARSVNAALPTDVDWMLRRIGDAERAVTAAGFDVVPIHGDGNVSNVLALDDGRLLLVDFDCAADADPLQDLGVALAELARLDTDAREAFEQSWGSWDAALFDRCRVYGVADQVRWGLIGAYCDAARPGMHEYSKFSDWQFLRARAALCELTFDDRLRNL